MSRVAIGIDLGTTYSGAAIFCDNLLRMIPDSNGSVIIPSLVAFDEERILVGDDVRYQMAYNAENSLFEIKRFIGKGFDDKTIQSSLKVGRWPFTVTKQNKKVAIQVNYKRGHATFLPEQISAMILKTIKKYCEKHLGLHVTDAVISVPAYFNENQRNATKSAGEIAGLNVLRIINEPTAAALSFGYGLGESDNEKNILVYDLGGGTFDVSILNIREKNFQVLATSGDSNLGGEDFTNRIRTHLIQEFKKSRNIDLSKNKLALIRLRDACEKAKRRLSSKNCRNVDVEIDSLCRNVEQVSIDYSERITRTTFEELNEDLFNYTIHLVHNCLEEAHLNISSIDEVVLVGGSTRIPKIQELIENYFGSQKINMNINPDEAVALGAAIEAAILIGKDSPLIHRTILLDVTPLSLGTDISNDEMSIVIRKNSLIPVRQTQRYVTCFDNQTSVHCGVYQGERANIKDNIFLGEFLLTDLRKAPRGETKLDITFDLNADGILTVTASEVLGNGASGENVRTITIDNSVGRLSKKEIQNLIEIAKQCEEADEKFRRKSSVKSELDHYIYDVQNFLSLKTSKEKVSTAQYRDCKHEYESALDFLETHKNADPGEYEDKLEDLREICDPVLGVLFHQDKGRKIGEYKTGLATKKLTSSKYDVD